MKDMNSAAGAVMLAAASVLALAGCAASSGEATGGNWTCSAEGLVSGSYSGGSRAYIHLQGYPDGNNYSVTLNNEGTVAEGKTKDGTPFSCIKQG